MNHAGRGASCRLTSTSPVLFYRLPRFMSLSQFLRSKPISQPSGLPGSSNVFTTSTSRPGLPNHSLICTLPSRNGTVTLVRDLVV